MQKLKLNFNRLPDQPSRLTGWILLFLGVAMLLEFGVSYYKLQNERAALTNEISTSKLQLDMSRKEPARQQYLEKDFEEVRQLINRLSTPWDYFFTGLESIKGQKVAILTIEPDMKTGVLRIEGEAKDFPAVLTFVSKLRTTTVFRSVSDTP